MLLCIKFYPKRQDFTEELEGTKKISKKRQQARQEQKFKGDFSRFYERQQTFETRQIFERKQTIFYSFFEMLCIDCCSKNTRQTPTLLLSETNRENIFITRGALCDWSSDETVSFFWRNEGRRLIVNAYFFEFFVFFFARTEADGVLLSKMGIHPRGEERW